MTSLLAAALIVFGAAALQSCTGFGFAIMATPLLFLIYDPHLAIQINILLSIVISVIMAPGLYRLLDRRLFKRLLIGGAAGLPLGLLVYLHAPTTILRGVVGGIVVLLTALLLVRVPMRRSPPADLGTGLLSGLTTTGLGMPGPPLLVYLAGTGTDKETLRSTTLCFFLFVYAASLATQGVAAGIEPDLWWLSAILLAPTLVGVVVGRKLFTLVDQRTFRYLTLALLGATGLYLVVETAGKL